MAKMVKVAGIRGFGRLFWIIPTEISGVEMCGTKLDVVAVCV